MHQRFEVGDSARAFTLPVTSHFAEFIRRFANHALRLHIQSPSISVILKDEFGANCTMRYDDGNPGVCITIDSDNRLA